MKKQIGSSFAVLVIISTFTFTAASQIATGSVYKLDQSVIASGGATSADSGGAYSITGTIGQSAAGTKSANSPFAVTGGFWADPALAPTVAQVTIRGRVRMENGIGVRNVMITLTQSDGSLKNTMSGTFGNYQFTDVAAGQVIILGATAKKFTFNQPMLVLNLSEDAADIDFIIFNQ